MNQSDTNPADIALNGIRSPLPLRSASSQNPEASAVCEPEIVGEYEILGKLGAGGMGTVWRARLHSGGRDVALKLLNSNHLASEISKNRFEREVDVASLLEHPNIARVYESGVNHGAYFYAMELINGLALDDYAEQCRLDRRTSLAVMGVVCHAMQYAHQKGVIHRDLKPSNILVDASNNPHIVDFGLGKLLDEQSPFSTISTRGEWAGTPAYMSPEQAAGLSDQIDTRSDIYSLGVILYQLVTTRLPHDTTGGNLAVLDRVAHAEIIRPRIASPSIDRDLEALLLKSLARRPEERYASVGEMADDIENYLKGDPLKARRPTLAYFLRKQIVKHRLPIGVAAAVIVVFIVIIANASIRIARERNLTLAAAANAESLRHISQISLADATRLNADSLARESHWSDASELYWDAYQIQAAERVSTVNTRLGLLDAIRYSPFELSQIAVDAHLPVPAIGVVFDSEGLTAWAEQLDGVAQPFDYLTALPGTATGQRDSEGHILGLFDCPETGFVFRFLARGTGVQSASEIQKVDLLHGNVETVLHFGGQLSIHADVSPDGASVVGEGLLANSIVDPGSLKLWLVHAASRASPNLLDTHRAPIRAVARSPDLRTIVTGDNQGHICFRDSATLDEFHPFDAANPLPGHLGTKEITCLKYAPDGSGILIGDMSGNVGFFALTGGRRSHIFDPAGTRVVVVGFSHDGQLALSGDDKGTLSVWDISTGELRRAFSAGAEVISAQFSPDDRMVLAYAKDGSARAWPIDLADQSILYQSKESVGCLAVSPDDLLAAIGTSKEADVIDVATGRCVSSHPVSEKVISLAFSLDDSTLDVVTGDGAIGRYEITGQGRRIAGCPSGTLQPEFATSGVTSTAKRSYGVLISTQSDAAVTVSERGIIVASVSKGQRSTTIDGHYMPFGCLSADGGTLFALATRPVPALNVINLRTGTIKSVSLQKNARFHVTAIAVSSDSHTVFLAYDDSTIHVFDLPSEKEGLTIACGGQLASFLNVSADGTVIFSAGNNGALRLWRVADGVQLRCLTVGSNSTFVTALSQQGDIVLCGGAVDNTVRIWDMSLPIRLWNANDKAALARHQLAADPSSITARAALVEWFELQGAHGWANHLLDEEHVDADVGIAAARSRWQANDFDAAVKDFDGLLHRNNSNLPISYLQTCRDAAARRE